MDEQIRNSAEARVQNMGTSLYPILAVNFVGTLGYSIILPFLVFLVTRLGGNALVYGIIGATYPAFRAAVHTVQFLNLTITQTEKDAGLIVETTTDPGTSKKAAAIGTPIVASIRAVNPPRTQLNSFYDSGGPQSGRRFRFR